MSASQGTGDGPDSELVEFAHRILDMARNGETERLTAYVDEGVPVNLTDPQGNTLLMLAAYHGHEATVRALLERGAEPDRLNDRGQSPLAGAVFQGAIGVVHALVEAGADPMAGTPSAIDSARMFGRDEMLALLTGPNAP